MGCHRLLQIFAYSISKTEIHDCSHEIKRRLIIRIKVMTNLDSIFKSRDITLPTKVCLVKAMVFPVVMHECESWSIKKAEHQRIDTFLNYSVGRLLRVPWTARRSNQSILKEVSPEYFGHFHFSLSCIGEGNGTPLQYSCLENPMDGGAW